MSPFWWGVVATIAFELAVTVIVVALILWRTWDDFDDPDEHDPWGESTRGYR